MKTRAESSDLPKINWQKIKKEGALGFSCKRDQFAFVFGACDLIDIL